MLTTSYHAGGLLPNASQRNRAEEYDSVTGTFTRWDQQGTQVERRPLTPAEAATLAAGDAQIAADANGGTLRQQALGAMVANRAFIAAAKPATAAAQASQAYDQSVALSRQMNRITRLVLGLLDGTD